jgi:hypothetical protein
MNIYAASQQQRQQTVLVTSKWGYSKIMIYVTKNIYVPFDITTIELPLLEPATELM